MFIFELMAKNKFSLCKAAKGGDAVASLTDNNAADENLGKSLVKL